MLRRIQQDALQHYDVFLAIYAKNLEKTLQVVPKNEVPVIRAQVEAARACADGKLDPQITLPGSHTAQEKARSLDRRGENMSEHWAFFTQMDAVHHLSAE